MSLPVTEAGLFVFCNKSRRQIKALYWVATGLALWHKRLERDQFKWPKADHLDVVTLNYEQSSWPLQGFDIAKIHPHSPIYYREVI